MSYGSDPFSSQFTASGTLATTIQPHDEVNMIIRQFEEKWSLGLRERPIDYSPRKSDKLNKPKSTTPEACINLIKYLYHQNREILNDVLLSFWRKEETFSEVNVVRQDRCERLRVLLQEAFNAVSTPGGSVRMNRKQETPSNKLRLSEGK